MYSPHQEPVFTPKVGNVVVCPLEVALAATINGLGGIEKGMEQSEERKSGWTPCLEK